MENIIIEQICHDETEPFSEIVFQAESEYAKVKTTFYVADSDLIELADSIKKLAENKTKEMYWEILPSICHFHIKGFYSDSVGHICFEIFSEIQDGNYYNDKPINKHKKYLLNILNKKSFDKIDSNKHQICFYIENLEPQTLLAFSENLKCIQKCKKVKMLHNY